jgi:hypothetical protein
LQSVIDWVTGVGHHGLAWTVSACSAPIISATLLDPFHARLPDGTDPADLLALKARQGLQTRWLAPNRWPNSSSTSG